MWKLRFPALRAQAEVLQVGHVFGLQKRQAMPSY